MHAGTILPLRTEALFIVHQLQSAGFEVYIVGGAVRDTLRYALTAEDQRPPLPTMDYDFATNAKPEEIQQIFPESFYENTFGTVSITPEQLVQQPGMQWQIALLAELPKPASTRLIDLAAATKVHSSLVTPTQDIDHTTAHEKYEITTYRSKELYDNHRAPTSLSWGTTIEEDLQRRDFTINSIAIRISQDTLVSMFDQDATIPLAALYPLKLDTDVFLYDTEHGLPDLAAGIIRTVGNPHKRFEEDALRLLRAIRFSVQLDMTIEPATWQAVIQQANSIEHVSWERIRDEFFKMLSSDRPKRAIELLDETKMLNHILPELQLGKAVVQGGHHTTDVWTHSLDALASCPSPDPIVRLATLIHDVGKPDTFRYMNGQPTFYNHEIVGAKMAKIICQRLRLSKQDSNRVYILVRHHMFHYQQQNTDAAIRRFMRKVGLDYIDDILDVREGDRLGSGARKTSWRLEEMKQRMLEQLHQPFDITDLAVNGHDLMKELALQPGPQLGVLLKQLFETVLEEPEKNNRESLLSLARELWKPES
ncbi:HDIG domain-containing protein [Candidatus Woesebacteria bacterium]|nr:HDIG domain-containing protein [Candidatus Woesebacteria bacterium]